jgi:hypothetical protein
MVVLVIEDDIGPYRPRLIVMSTGTLASVNGSMHNSRIFSLFVCGFRFVLLA